LCSASLEATFGQFLEAESAYRVLNEPRDESRVDEEKRRSNEKWRSRIVDWKYQVIDHYGYSRELVAISMSILDRYSSLRAVSKKCYQLAAMSSLHLSIKLSTSSHGGASGSSFNDLVDLSKGIFTRDHVLVMEGVLLEEIEWRVHPVTPCVVVRHLLLLCPEESVEQVLEVAIFLTELAICDSYFVPLLSSTVALASILSAFRALPLLPPGVYETFASEARARGFDLDGAGVREAADKLDDLSCAEADADASSAAKQEQPVTPGAEGRKQRNSVSPTAVDEFDSAFGPSAPTPPVPSPMRGRDDSGL